MRKAIRPVQKGFTLIELAVVIAIIAILAAVAIPRFGNTTATAECSNIKDFVSQLNSAMSIYTAEQAGTPSSFSDFVSTTALGAPGTDVHTISTVTFGTNAKTAGCGAPGATLTCTGTFKSYSPVTYTFGAGGQISVTTATPVGTAPVCLK